MAKSPNKPAEPASTLQAPSNEVWLAGLGALAQVQAQGSKAFEKLVGDGLSFQRKSQEQAQQRLQEATARLSDLAQDFGQHAVVRVDKLEHLFEERVAKALHRLGIPTLQDMQVLQARIHTLEEQLALSRASKPSAAKTAAAPAKATPAARKTPAKKASSSVKKARSRA